MIRGEKTMRKYFFSAIPRDMGKIVAFFNILGLRPLVLIRIVSQGT